MSFVIIVLFWLLSILIIGYLQKQFFLTYRSISHQIPKTTKNQSLVVAKNYVETYSPSNAVADSVPQGRGHGSWMFIK